MLFNKVFNLIILFAGLLFGMMAVSNASAQEVQAAQVKEAGNEESPNQPSESVSESAELTGFDLNLGVGLTNYFALPAMAGFSYQFTSFYSMSVDIKLALLFKNMFAATWMNMFKLCGNEHMALSVGAGIGYLAVDDIQLVSDDYDYDEDPQGKKGVVFPASIALDWHTNKDTSLRLQVDFNNYYVVEDNRDWLKYKVPRYEFHYNLMFVAVMHL